MHLPKIAFTPFVLLALAGCAGAPVSDGPAPALPDQMAPPQVSFTSYGLRDAFRFAPITRTVDPNGIVHLTVALRDVAGEDIPLDYRFTWLDDQRAVVDQPASWQTQTTHAGAYDVITAVAPSPRATDFRLDFRPAQ